MAAVFAGTHRNGNRVAIKILHPLVAVDPGLRERFLREGYVANAVGHEGAVAVLDDDTTEDGAVFLVMELLEGETLDARAQRLGGHLPLAEVVRLGEHLLEVLVAAHGKGIVHRDIKPENIFMTRKGQLKVLDFGIARLLELAGATGSTRTGSTLGTPAFMPPEQALGHVKEIDGRSDIWAVGATMFALLSGRTVHDGSTVGELLVAAATKPARSISVVVPETPILLARVIDRALSFEKHQRWADAAEMLGALRDATEATTVLPPIDKATEGQTIAAAPRRAQFGSSHVPVSPSTSGNTVGMTAADPHTVSAIAVGRTISDNNTGHAPAQRKKKALLVLVGALFGGTSFIAVAVVAVGLLGRSPHPAERSVPSAPSPAQIDGVLPALSYVAVEESALPGVPNPTLDILSEGGSCSISIDKVPRGTTPIRALKVAPGSHEVTCRVAAFVEIRKIAVETGQSKQVTFVIPKPSPKAPSGPPTAPPRPTSQRPPKHVNPLDIR
jgi:serine/threonine-protein kinase